MSTIGYIEKYYDQLQAGKAGTPLANIRKGAFADLNKMGIPGSRHEEWKYTRIGSLFNREYQLASVQNTEQLNATDINNLRLPGSAQANELVFINGKFSLELSSIRTAGLVVLSLEEALNGEYKDIVSANFGHSAQYLKDGINALSTALVSGALFVHVRKGKMMKHPIYIYNITDARFGNILSQPRSLVHIGEQAQVQIVENFITVGKQDSITNHVIEIAAEKDSITDYYKIQNDASNANLVSTTHVLQLGKSIAHTVTITLNGGMVRNNLNLVMEADHCEAHLYGLYFQQGNTHVDNHTVVDNVKPHCYSNELYKGILKDNATGVFNGKIFVRPQAQKTNAYQSNKNILLSDLASVNTKPQLEIFADDVKCSHGCTVGQLDEEALFYLRSRGIQEETATSMLLHGFAIDVLEKIKLDPIRAYVDRLIDERLEFETI